MDMLSQLIQNFRDGAHYQIVISNKLKGLVEDPRIDKEYLYQQLKEIERRCTDSIKNKLTWQTFNKEVNYLLDNVTTSKVYQNYLLQKEIKTIKLKHITCLQLEDFRSLKQECFGDLQTDFIINFTFSEDEIIAKYCDFLGSDDGDDIYNAFYKNKSSYHFGLNVQNMQKQMNKQFSIEEAENLLNKRKITVERYYKPLKIDTDIETYLRHEYQRADPFVVRFVCRCSVMTYKDIEADYLNNDDFPIEFLDICTKIAEYFRQKNNNRQVSKTFNALTLIRLPADEKAALKRIQYYKSGKNDHLSRANTMIREDLVSNWIKQYAINMNKSYTTKCHKRCKQITDGIIEKQMNNLIILDNKEIQKFVYPFVDEQLQSKIKQAVINKSSKGCFIMIQIPYIFNEEECSEPDLLQEDVYRWVLLYSNKTVYRLIKEREVRESKNKNITYAVNVNTNQFLMKPEINKTIEIQQTCEFEELLPRYQTLYSKPPKATSPYTLKKMQKEADIIQSQSRYYREEPVTKLKQKRSLKKDDKDYCEEQFEDEVYYKSKQNQRLDLYRDLRDQREMDNATEIVTDTEFEVDDSDDQYEQPYQLGSAAEQARLRMRSFRERMRKKANQKKQI